MSAGLMCLECRRYVGPHPQCCKCEKPRPSLDGRTELTPEQQADPKFMQYARTSHL